MYGGMYRDIGEVAIKYIYIYAYEKSRSWRWCVDQKYISKVAGQILKAHKYIYLLFIIIMF